MKLLMSSASGPQPPRGPAGLEGFRAGTERDCMLQLAAEAFQAGNFDLAADIYACRLGEQQLGDPPSPGGRLALLLKRADALAFGGKLSEAFGVYREAAEIETLRPPHLETLVDFLTERVRRRRAAEDEEDASRGEGGGAGDAGSWRARSGPSYAFSCRVCQGFLFEPVTLACGHTFCKKCLERERGAPGGCRECRSSSSGSSGSSRLSDGHSHRVNVVLNGLLTKWFPGLTRAARLRREGNGLYAERRMEEALEKYNEAILIAPRDHILFSNRSQILNSLRRYEEALRDADKTCSLMPYWSKGHVRRAQALVALGRTEEALREYLLCLSLEADCRLARTEAHKLLSDLLAPDPVPDRLLDPRSHLKNIMHTPTYTHAAEQTHTHAHTLPAACTSKNLFLSKYPSESKLCISSALNYPQSLSERSEGTEVKGHGETEGWTVERVLKRKRRSGEEEGGEWREDWKRFKPESPDVIGSWSAVVGNLIDPTDLECSLCMRLFYEPVTTPCGHSFCLQCLERCLDHNPVCPLCKEQLSEYLAQRQYYKTVLMESLIFRFLPSELSDRQQVNHEELAELSNLNKNVPIFVCTMAFPTVPCPLHIFEPCYRLMIRRCMETGTKRFGMCLADNLNGFADYGCLLEIRNVEFFSDGRSVVDTIGRRRFKVLQHQQRDGYNTADIEYIEDIKVVEGVAEQELRCLHDMVYEQALRWVSSLTSQQNQRIVTAFGHMPDKESEPQASPNGPSWCWWLLAVLPLEGRAQLPFLALTSLKERLSGIRRVLLFMARSRHR